MNPLHLFVLGTVLYIVSQGITAYLENLRSKKGTF